MAIFNSFLYVYRRVGGWGGVHHHRQVQIQGTFDRFSTDRSVALLVSATSMRSAFLWYRPLFAQWKSNGNRLGFVGHVKTEDAKYTTLSSKMLTGNLNIAVVDVLVQHWKHHRKTIGKWWFNGGVQQSISYIAFAPPSAQSAIWCPDLLCRVPQTFSSTGL
jgi:hypothetical protein